MTTRDEGGSASRPSTIRLRVLGALEVVSSNGTPLVMASHRQRVVLSLLLLEANHTVRLDRLIEAVWDGAPPATARAQIQICVSQLRRRLREAGLQDAIDTSPSGYVMTVTEATLDLLRCDALMSDARYESRHRNYPDALHRMRAALRLWRGPVLPDVDSALIRAVATRLDRRRLHLLEEKIALEVELGHNERALRELTPIVDAYPLRERLWGLFMISLHRTGRRTDALEAFRSARTALVRDLGIEPGGDLQRIHLGVMNDEPLTVPFALIPTS